MIRHFGVMAEGGKSTSILEACGDVADAFVQVLGSLMSEGFRWREN